MSTAASTASSVSSFCSLLAQRPSSSVAYDRSPLRSSYVASTRAHLLLTACRERADVVIALDSSFSVGRENYLAMTDFVRSLVTDLPMQGDVRLGLLAFTDTAQVCLAAATHQISCFHC